MMAGMSGERGTAVVSDDVGNRAVVEYWRPVIWSAVLGGAVAALGVQLILTLFGVGLGAAMVNPWSAPGADVDAIGVKAAVCTILTGIISFGVGGYIAGHMSGVLRTGSGAAHGMLAWAAAAVFGVTVAAMAGSVTVGSAGATAANAYQGSARSDIADRGAVGRNAGLTDDEVALAAERTAEAVARVALITGVAFLLSMIAASAGGMVGRTGLRTATRQRPTSGQPQPA